MYPEAYMVDAMKIWKLPAGKESMLSEICQGGKYFLQEKIDGCFYQFERTENYGYLFSRSESKNTGLLSDKAANVPHIMEALSVLPPGTIIIGEIYYPGGTSKTATTITGCSAAEAIRRQKNNPIHYYMHDIIMYEHVNLMETGAEDRYNILKAVWEKHNLAQYDFLRLAVKVDTDLETEISRILKSGGEGVVLKKRDYPYTPGKRPAWSTIKVKQMDSIDLVCMGFCDATREYTGIEIDSWTYWEETDLETGDKRICGGNLISDCNRFRYDPVTKPYALGWKTAIKIGGYNDQGELVELGTVSSGLTDELKSDFAQNPDNYLGRVCSLDCMSIDKKEHTLRHPVFKMWRDDKSAKDCLISEVFA